MDSFNKKQKDAFEAMINGHNVFITGPGGSGKSHVINYFVNYFKNSITHIIKITIRYVSQSYL